MVIAGLAAVISLGGCAPEPATDRQATEAATAMTPVKRGEYLVTVSGCHDCHTPGTLYGKPDFARALSGSELGWAGPWGVTFPRNLTPDSATGIGTWSEQEIIRAIRSGYRPDGTILSPPMPWPSFARFTDEDAAAIAAYLKSLPPIAHQAPEKIGPDQPFKGAALKLPPPPAWDAPRTQ